MTSTPSHSETVSSTCVVGSSIDVPGPVFPPQESSSSMPSSSKRLGTEELLSGHDSKRQNVKSTPKKVPPPQTAASSGTLIEPVEEWGMDLSCFDDTVPTTKNLESDKAKAIR